MDIPPRRCGQQQLGVLATVTTMSGGTDKTVQCDSDPPSNSMAGSSGGQMGDSVGGIMSARHSRGREGA